MGKLELFPLWGLVPEAHAGVMTVVPIIGQSCISGLRAERPEGG